MTATGGEPVELATGTGNDIDPAWSPDGSRLAFASFRDGGWNIFTVAPEGGVPKRITEGLLNVVNVAPSWSPDGKDIVFQSDRDGQQHIFRIPAEGGTATRLTEGTTLDLSPAWPAR